MFQFKNFALKHDKSTLKIGTDSVLLSAAVPLNNVKNVLDIGCGCGVIAFCIADRLHRCHQTAHITGIDIDATSIKEAHENNLLFPFQPTHNTFIHTSLQDFSENTHNLRFDLIVSNPPFFAHSLKPATEARQKSKHSDSTLPFHELACCVSKIITENGLFYLILPVIEGGEFETIAQDYLHLTEKITIFPKEHKAAHRLVLGFSKTVQERKESQIIIRNDDNSYHHTYQEITRDFYLNF